MTLIELTEEDRWNLPRVGAPQIDNCIATILFQKNRSKWLDLDRIAKHQGFDPAGFRARFAHLETAWEAELSRRSMVPANSFECEGK